MLKATPEERQGCKILYPVSDSVSKTRLTQHMTIYMASAIPLVAGKEMDRQCVSRIDDLDRLIGDIQSSVHVGLHLRMVAIELRLELRLIGSVGKFCELDAGKFTLKWERSSEVKVG